MGGLLLSLRAYVGNWAVRALVATLALAAIAQFGSDPAPLPAAPLPVAPVPAAPSAAADSTRIALEGHEAPPSGLNPGQVRSLLNVAGRMHYGDYRWDERNVAAGPVLVRIDRSAQIISVFRAGHEIGTAVILYGAPEKPTPAGTYPVLGKAAYHRSNAYNADMPFTLWLTRDGVAIHGSRVREGAATHGCIGLPEDFARKLFDQVSKGDPVVIV